jgi:hypothetical protein
MPTETFLNLPTEKREAQQRLALLEFADHDYQCLAHQNRRARWTTITLACFFGRD